jgi:diguanylate cyclase (GGDEF)-like protein
MASRLIKKLRESFSAKVIALVMISVLLTSFVVGLVTTNTTSNFLIDRAREKFPSTLTGTYSKIRFWYSRHARDLGELCQSTVFRENLERYDVLARTGKPTMAERGEMAKYLGLVHQKFPIYEDILLVDDTGALIVGTPDVGAAELPIVAQFVHEAAGNASFTRTHYDADGAEVKQWMLLPILQPGMDRVWLAACINLRSLRDLLNDASIGAGADIYILDAQGRFLTQPRHVADNCLWRNAMSVPTRQEGPIVVEDRKNYRGKRVLMSKVHILEHGWWLVYEDDYRTTMAPVISAKRQIWVAVLIIFVIATIVALRMVRSILQPIRSLALGARRINEGLVGVTIPRASSDEIGLLTDTFNEMAKTITLSKAELQYKNKMLNSQNDQLQDMNVRLEQLSVTDGLTGLYNHRHFWNILDKELARVDRYQADLALILVDLDDFKRVNDQFGHSVGDLLLQSIARILRATVRDTDIVARYGGEEFAVLLPETDRGGVESVAEKVRASVEEMRFTVPDTDISLRVTVSVGISVFRGNRREFFNSADKALYQSKAAGKNRIHFAAA